MTRQNRDGPASRFEAIFNVHWARHEARMARAMAAHERAMAAHERAMAAAELRMAGAMRAHERAMEAAERRAEDVLRRDYGRRPDMPPKDLFKRRWGKRRPDAEGGEPMPAVPRPKPRPLAGAAAAPIE